MMRWKPHPAVFGVIFLASALSVFWGGGQLGMMDASGSLEDLLRSVTGEVSTPAEGLGLAPVVIGSGIVAGIAVVTQGMAWAFFGTFLWLLGMLAGGISVSVSEMRRMDEAKTGRQEGRDGI